MELLKEVVSGAQFRGLSAHPYQELFESRAPEEGHAQGTQVARGKIQHPVERNNVRVLESGQRQVLLACAGGELEHHGPVGQRRLSSQENTSHSTAA